MEKKTKKAGKKSWMQMDLKDLNLGFLKKVKKLNNSTKIETRKKVVAFDIGSSNIKVVEGMYYKNKLSINKCMEIPTPDDCVDDADIVNNTQLLSTVQYMLEENRISAKDAICTTNSSQIINRELVIPKVEEDEMETYVKYQMQQYLSINLDNYILQVTTLDEEVEGEEGKMKVRVISFPKKIVSAYYKFLNDLNLRPYVLDVTFNSVSKILNMAGYVEKGERENRVVAAIDMGAASINVNIYNKGILEFTRMVKSGGNEIDYMLHDKFYCTKNNYVSVISEKANLQEDTFSDENKEIKDIVDEWVEKIDKILHFYKNKNGNIQIDKIYIYGETSRIKGMDRYIETKLNIATERINNINNKNIVIKDNDADIDTFLNAIGSVIRL